MMIEHDKKQKKTKQKQKQKQRPSQKFKQLCKQQLRKQPSIYLLNSIKDKTIMLDLDILQPDDVVFIPYMFKLLITKLHMFCQEGKKVGNGSAIYTTMKFKDVLKEISNAIVNSASFKSLTFQRVPLTIRHMMMLKESIQTSQNLKQLSFRHCLLADEHLQVIKTAIAKNQSLVILDLSNNKLRNVGSMVGKIMSDHSSRRDQLIWFASLRGQPLLDDLSKKGICEVNLENNQLDDKSATELVSFMKDDQWSRCLNLRDNQLTQKGIKQFAKLIKKNSSLISLDLRGNPGFTKQYSLYILKKLKQNIEKYKQQKKGYIKNKKMIEQQVETNQNKKDQHKSLQQSRHQSLYKKIQSPAALEFTMSNNNNITSLHPSRKSPIRKLQTNTDDNHCKKCKQSTLDILKLSKRNLDLQLQIKRLKHILLTKNIDLSAILPHSHTHINLSTASQMSPQPFHRALQLVANPSSSQSDEQLILKVQQILMELTRIMDNMQSQQVNHNQTQINLSNNISNAHSLSNTIPLFMHPQGLQQLEIEDESSIDKMPMQNSNINQQSREQVEHQHSNSQNKTDKKLKLIDKSKDHDNSSNNGFSINIKNQN